MGLFRTSLFNSGTKRGVFARFWPWFALFLVFLALMGGGFWFAQNRLQQFSEPQAFPPEMVNGSSTSSLNELPTQGSVASQNREDTSPAQMASVTSNEQGLPKNEMSKPEQARMAVKQTLSNWASAWSGLDAAGYLSFYGSDFEPPEGLSRNEWEQQRQARINNKNHIDVTLENLAIETDAEGKTAIARFTQHYRSDSFKETTQKTMVLVPQNGQWKIVAERAD